MYIIDKLLEIIGSRTSAEIPDALCIRLGYAESVDYIVSDPEIDPETFVSQHTFPFEKYKFDYWQFLKEEICAEIKGACEDDVKIRHLMQHILVPLEDLSITYFRTDDTRPRTVFENIVYYRFRQGDRVHFDSLPDYLIEEHRNLIEEEVKWGDILPEEKDAELERRCAKTLEVWNKGVDEPCFKHCLYYYRVLKRFASLLEYGFLENRCKRDLFAYQKEFGIVLFPRLDAADIALESNMPQQYIIELADGYSILDNYTSFAGYGDHGRKHDLLGVKFSGIPEVDGLFLNIESKVPYYPEHHFKRNFTHFKGVCREMAESDSPQEKKVAFIQNLILILGQSYLDCVNRYENKFTRYPMLFFVALESEFLQVPHPICVKDICIDMQYDFLLTDPFPETVERAAKKKKGEFVPEGRWEEYGLEDIMTSSYEYYRNRICNNCSRSECLFRKCNGVQQEGKPEPLKKSKQLATSINIHEAAVIICDYLSKIDAITYVKHSKSNQWIFKGHGELYAYIGAALKYHMKIKKFSWDTLMSVLHTSYKLDFVTKQASIYHTILKNNQDKDSLPGGFRLVDDAISTLPDNKKTKRQNSM